MKTVPIELAEKIDELLVLLEADAEQMKVNLSLLDELRSLVIKRDEATLVKLLNRIKFKSQDHDKRQLKRAELRKQLSVVIGCPSAQVKLSKLEKIATEEQRPRITQMRSVLTELAGQLRSQYSATAMILADCARLNRMLVDTMFKSARTNAVIYGSDGSARRELDGGFVNLKY